MSNLKELKNKLSSLKSEKERFEREIETNKARKDDPNWIYWNQFSSEKNQRLDGEISRFSDALKDVTREINRYERQIKSLEEERSANKGRSVSNENEGGCLSSLGNLFWLMIFVSIVSVFFSQEDRQTLTSRDGRLKIKYLVSYQEACKKGQARSSYSTKRGVRGKLYPSKCNQAVSNGNVEEYLFLDNVGDHRCQGRAKISTFEGKTVTYWRVDKKVPGYICKTVGETYSIEMN